MARGLWKGTLGFGLVTIGVELYSAESPERFDLDLLDKRDMARVGYLKINKNTGKPIESKDIVKGYEVGSNKYVILTDDDLKAANPKATQSIDVIGFVPAGEIPLIYFAKPYLIGPTKGSEKAYHLFKETLEEMERVAIAQVVIRTRGYMAAVYPYDDALIVQLLRYDDEVRKPSESGITINKSARTLRAEEKAMAKKLVAGMETEWEPSKYRDEYRDDLLKLVKQRAKGAKPAQEEPAEAPSETRVIDLMEALRKSVRETGGSAPAKRTSHAKRSRKSA